MTPFDSSLLQNVPLFSRNRTGEEAGNGEQEQKNHETFVEVGYYQLCKHTQRAEGDVFLSQKNPSDGRVITTLSDGLGSGIKAGVLATLTATMATKFIANDMSIRRAAEIIMNTLPVCKDRGISYATFTLVDIEPDATVRIMEYDNPPYVLVRQETVIEPIKDITPIQRKDKTTAPKREALLLYSSYKARPGDRLIFFSDGVTQSGMGSPCCVDVGESNAPVPQNSIFSIFFVCSCFNR